MAVDLIYSVEEKSGYITINRKEELNSLSASMVEEFLKCIEESERDERIRVIVIRGTKKIFCAGVDLKDVAKVTNVLEGYQFLERIGSFFQKIESLSKPVIAAINGLALGGGCELAMACDLRLASSDARFGFPEVNIGSFPAAGGISRLPSIVGIAKAKELIFIGKQLSAQEAFEIGLVHFVTPASKFEEGVRALADELASKATMAIGIAKKALRVSTGMDGVSSRFVEALLGGLTFDTEDQKEGMSAFLQKRKPSFKGR